MISIRSLTATELALAQEATVNEQSAAALPPGFLSDFVAAKSCPEWCFVAEEGAQPIAWVGCRAPDSCPQGEQKPETVIISALHLPWHDRFPEVGRPLLRESLSRLSETGAGKVRYDFSTAWFFADEPQFPDLFAAQRLQFALQAGMDLRQERINFAHRGPLAARTAASLLQFRSLAEVGEQAYIDAIERVTVGTLDRVLQQGRTTLGPRAHAERFFRDEVGIFNGDEPTYEQHLWNLAYTSEGALVGLIAPEKMWGTLGTIGYYGVVPEQRGHGCGSALLRQGTAALKAEGIAHVVTDTDSENLPSQQALRRVGYAVQGRAWAFDTDIELLLCKMT